MKDEVVSQERLDQRNLNKKHAALRKCVLDSGKTSMGKPKGDSFFHDFSILNMWMNLNKSIKDMLKDRFI